MTNFGWRYPPGVTGNEIAGYEDELWIEKADEDVCNAVKNHHLRMGRSKVQANILSNIFFKIWDLTDKAGPDEMEVQLLSYVASKRHGLSETAARDSAEFVTDNVLYTWEDLRNLWNLTYSSFEDTGPDPDQQYEEMRDREWDRD